VNNKIAEQIYLKSAEYFFKESRKIFSEVMENEKLRPIDLKTKSTEKLNAIIKYSYLNFPYYKNKFMSMVDNFDNCTFPDDLCKLPILTKEELRDHGIMISNSKGNMSKTMSAKTSGSTGIPLKFSKDMRSFYYSQAAMYRGHSWHGSDMGDREAMLWGIPIDFKNRIFVKTKDFLLNRFRENSFNISDDVFEDFYKKCVSKRPIYLMGYTSMVFQFAYFIMSKKYSGKKLNFKFIKCTSETISDYQRDLIEEIFGCKLVGEYGAAETGLIAFECPNENYHIMSDCCHVEVIRQGKHVDDGEIGKVIVTDFHNYALPIIRYDVGDIAKYTKNNCACGKPFPIIESITGRSSNIVISTSGKPFHSIVFYYIMKDYTAKNSWIKQFKIIQERQDLISVIIASTNNSKSPNSDELTKRIKDKLGKNMHVDYVYVEEIDRNPSGKFCDFESRIDTTSLLKELY
jgi:phenylacetate-CoA ligase